MSEPNANVAVEVKEGEADLLVEDKVEKNSQESINEWSSIFPKSIYEMVGIFFFVSCIYFTQGDVNKWIFGFWIVLTFFGGYSGGHVNPAITLGFFIYDGNFTHGLVKLFLYWIFQVLGALMAGRLGFWITKESVYVHVPKHSTTWEVMFAEFLFTGTFLFIILYVCSKVTTPPNSNAPINCAIIIGWFYCAVNMGAKISGAAYNPAIILALNGWEWFHEGHNGALNHTHPHLNPDHHPLWMVWKMILAEFAGAAVFALIFKFIFEKTYDDKSKNLNDQKI